MNKIKSTMMLLAGLVACSVAAEEYTDKKTGISWRYSVSGDTACIMGFSSEQTPKGKNAIIGAKKLTVPDKVGRYFVTEIDGEALGQCPDLATVNLPSKLGSIPDALFMSHGNLKTVKIPASVKSIGKEAFRDCAQLATLTIPASVTDIGESAFAGCGKLAKIEVEKGNRAYCNRKEKDVAGALFNKDGTTLVAWPAGCATAAVKIPAGVTSIGDFAFESERITSIAIPASVTNIGDCAFANCPKLSVIYAEAGDLDRLKSVIAVHNPKPGQFVEGRHYKGGIHYKDQMDKIKIEEKGKKR